MSEITLKEHFLNAFHASSGDFPGTNLPWLNKLRETATAQFDQSGIPTIKNEDWRYTNLRPMEKHRFTPATPKHNGISMQNVDQFSYENLDSHRIVFVNGHHAKHLSNIGNAHRVSISSLRQTLQDTPEKLEPYLNQIVPDEPHGLTALNCAFAGDGAFVELNANCELDKPVEFLFIANNADDVLINMPRNLVVAHDNSRATIVERYVASDDHIYFTNAVTEIHAASGATIQHYKLQGESLKAFHVGGLFARQDKDSNIESHSIAFGGALVRNDLRNHLNARGAQCWLNGLYLGTGRQHVDNHTYVDHAVANCTSKEYYKGILDGRSRAVFHGRVLVRQDAQQTDAEQNNQNLLLSKNAEVDTKPQLEIYADDVKCSHGATVGQLDDSAVFYLRSRGIADEQARDLLTYAFANEVLSRIEIEPVRRSLEHTLSERLLHGRSFEEVA